MNRLPFAPLAEAVGPIYMPQRGTNQYGPWAVEEWVRHKGTPIAVISELTGVGRRRLGRWQKAGVPEDEADRIACALGLHPSLIWPQWFGPGPCPPRHARCAP